MSIFSDPVLSGQLLKSRGWPLYTGSTVLEFRENRDSKESVTLSSTVIKLCGALYAFNIKRSSVEKKKIVQSFHVEKKIHADKLD